jgi:glycosyltransferase involved in cell wall biosynthesis
MRRQARTTFLFAGRFITFKGLHLAVDALAEAVRRGADVSFVAVGDGPLREPIQAQINRLGLQDRVELRKHIPQRELMSLYHHADAFLFPSLHDSSGNVVLESLSRGLPVICLNLGGPPCFVDATCGIVVNVDGLSRAQLVSALADAIVDYAGRADARRQAMSDAACARAAPLTWERQVAALYEGVST